MSRDKLSELGLDDDVKTLCACFQLRKAARVVTQLYDSYMHQAGVTPAQFSLLMIAWQQGPLTPSELAAMAVLDKTTLSRNLRPLQKRGLLQATPSRADRRAKTISITGAGIETLRQVAPRWKAVQDKMISSLGEAGFARLMSSLDEVIAQARA